MSQLDLGTQQLELERYPQQEESTQLQAWEAADEYLLQQLENTLKLAKIVQQAGEV